MNRPFIKCTAVAGVRRNGEDLAEDRMHCVRSDTCMYQEGYVAETEQPSVARIVRPAGAGVKHDDGKNRLGLLFHGFPHAIWHAGLVGTHGAEKYTPGGWKDVPNGVERYSDAMYRHLLAYETGEEFDEESGHTHLAHALWDLMAVLELTIQERMNM